MCSEAHLVFSGLHRELSYLASLIERTSDAWHATSGQGFPTFQQILKGEEGHS